MPLAPSRPIAGKTLIPLESRQLFIHDTSVMSDPGYTRFFKTQQHYFAERALWLATEDDLVVLARDALILEDLHIQCSIRFIYCVFCQVGIYLCSSVLYIFQGNPGKAEPE